MSDRYPDNDPHGPNAEALARVLLPIDQARGLPNPFYTDPRTHADECARVLFEQWACAGFANDVAGAGDTHPVNFAGLPLVIVRGRDKVIRVFHNVCQHRGRTLVEVAETAQKAMVCPYHRWAYDLEGKLIVAAHVGGAGTHECLGFDKAGIHLKPVRSAEWMGLVFVDISGAAAPFSDFIQPIAERWRDFADLPLIHTGTDCSIAFTLNCNWKLAVENYCEAYHLPWVHPGLNRYSPLDQHHNIVEPTYAGQFSACYTPSFPDGAPAFPNAPGLPAYWDSGAEYVALFPNVLLGIHRDHFFAVLILPDGPAKTHERMEIFYFDDAARDANHAPSRRANRALWESVFSEDRDAVEAMQRGRHSPGFDGGVFSPVMDLPTHAFHKWVARSWTEAGSARAADTDATF